MAGAAFGQAAPPGQGGYTGPAVLSRAGSPLGQYTGKPIAFRFFAGATGDYFGDLSQPVTDAAGNLVTGDAYGATGRVGVYGVRNGPNSTLGVDYLGNYRMYFGGDNQRYDGIDQNLGVNYARQVSVRTAFELSARASTYSYSGAGLSLASAGDPGGEPAPDLAEGFDNRVSRVTGQAGFSRSLTQRWVLTLGGGGSVVERRSEALLDTRNGMGLASVRYRVSQFTAVGPSYEFSYLDYPDNFESARVHNFLLSFEKQFGPRWKLEAGAGVYRADIDRVQSVPLDPILAAVIGRPTTLQPFFDKQWGPAVRATLSRTLSSGSFSIFYWRGIRSGTAFLATSESDSVGVRYSFNATSRLNIGLGANYYGVKAVSQGNARYDAYGGGAGLNYRLGKGFHITAAVSYNHQKLDDSTFGRDRVLASAGLMFSPGELPLSLF